MGSLIIILIVIAAYCNETHCDTLPTAVIKPEDTGVIEKNNSYTIEKGFFWKNLSRQKSLKIEEFKNLVDSANNETSKRKSRLLDGLAFLAGLSFGGLATAASSVKSVTALPQGSFSLNVGSSKPSPYLTATYYNPYPLLAHPVFYPSGSFGLVPINSAKPQATPQNDLTSQVISIFENRPQLDLDENNKEFVDTEKKFGSDKSAEADDRTDLRAAADRNAEEKIRGCKEGQRKHGNFLKDLLRAREDFYTANNSDTSANMTVNQTMTTNATMTSPPIQNTTYYVPPQYTVPSYPGYFGGYPQNVNHVDLTTSSDVYHYQNPSHINYNLPHEKPNFYHNDRHNVYSNHHVNSYFSGPYPSDQINEHADYNRYQSLYDSFRPVK